MYILRPYDIEILTITPFSKLQFWEQNIFCPERRSKVVNFAKQTRWLFWQEKSNFYFSFEFDPKGGPQDELFPFSCWMKPYHFAPLRVHKLFSSDSDSDYSASLNSCCSSLHWLIPVLRQPIWYSAHTQLVFVFAVSVVTLTSFLAGLRPAWKLA